MNKKNCLMVLIIILNLVIFNNAFAQDTCANGDAPPCDEQATFKSVDPDALIILDLSGSMTQNPVGDYKLYGNSLSCNGDTTHCNYSDCAGGFCASSHINCSADCSKLAIAKRTLFNILDDNSNNVIDTSDSSSLGVRFGYMRFNGADTGADYSSGNIKLIKPIASYYQSIYCGASKTGSCAASATCSSGECIANATTNNGGTAIVSSLVEAKKYLDYTKIADNAASCRKKFVILITDGADTYACGGGGTVCSDESYGARREVVAKAQALAVAGYTVFVVGFGDMPAYLQNTLNWMAFYGGTDNPLVTNSGDVAAYNPANTASCQAETSFVSGVCGVTTYPNFFAATNDPGTISLGGYAFLASNADQLTAALRSAITTITASTYSFTQASIQASRTIDESFLYEASFSNRTYDPFWIGHLKRYKIGDHGVIASTADWDAGDVLKSTAAANRSIWTLKNSSGSPVMTLFTSAAGITASDLGVTTDTNRDKIINFIRGGELVSGDDYFGWKLGDVFHASPMSIATPNALFYDQWDKSTTKAFATYRDNHERTSANGKRIILIGANDGQLHAFKTGEVSGTTGGGSELWSFIPPNLLPKLMNIAHSTHPTLLTHHYFVDGPISAAEIWLGTGTIGSTSKSVTDWHTYFVLSEGRGGKESLWSSSTSCDSGFSATYSSTNSNYCGYYAFDISDTASTPVYKWRIGGNSALSATHGNHLGEPWGKMFIGRVRESNTEKWVGLIGGGYSNTNCKGGGGCDQRGKGFYVIDLSDGSILWSVTHSGPGDVINGDMDFDLAASPVAVDTDNDGFLDTAYIPDLGGNVWRFKFCRSSSGTSCSKSDWTASLLFSTPSGVITPIYNPVSVATDTAGKLWVYFGSGDKTDPTANNAQENFYAIKDDRSTKYTISDLESIGSETGTGTYTGEKDAGWYINFTGHGEKILSEPLVFEGKVFFTTYIPGSISNPCDTSGKSKVYGVDYMTGAGIFANGAKGQNVGTGMATGVTASRGPDGGTNFYVSMSVGDLHTKDIPNIPNSNAANNSIIYWLDKRLQ